MEIKANARWKGMRRASAVFSALAFLAFAAAIAFALRFLPMIENPKVRLGYEDFWPSYVSTAAFIVFFALAGSLRTSSYLVAYRELLRKERRVAVIAQITGENPGFTAIRIANFIRQGKLDASFVDTEKGVVVVTREKDDALREEPSAKAPPAGARPAVVRAVCPGCGAAADIPFGQTAECEYCGAAIYGADRKEQTT